MKVLKDTAFLEMTIDFSSPHPHLIAQKSVGSAGTGADCSSVAGSMGVELLKEGTSTSSPHASTPTPSIPIIGLSAQTV